MTLQRARWRPVTLACVALGALTIGQSSLSQNSKRLFVTTPFAQFTPEDHRLLKSATVAACESPEPNVVHRWENPATGARGTTQGGKSFTAADGRKCRSVRFENQAGTLKNVSTYSVCQTTDGDWLIDAVAKPPAG